MADDDRASPNRGLRDKVSFFEKVWSGTATSEVEDSQRRVRRRDATPESDIPHEEIFERRVEEGDVSGVSYVKFERLTVKRTVTETRTEILRPESPEWVNRREYVRSKSEFDSHIAEIRGKYILKMHLKLQKKHPKILRFKSNRRDKGLS